MKSIFLILFMVVNASLSFSQQVFNKIYNDSLNQFSRANATLQTSDSNFIIIGNTASLDKMSAVKINKYGDTIWTFVADLGINSVDYIRDVIELNDGNYIVCGVSGDPILMNSNADIIKFDKNTGDTIWVRKIGLPNRSERFYSIKETSDHGFIASGLRYNADGSDNDIYLVKTDSMGMPEWERTYGGSNYDFANAIEIADDGGFMLFGTTYSYGEGAYNMYLVKTDIEGNQLWQKTYGGVLEDYGTSMCKLQDGNYVLAGSSYFSVDSTAAHLLKIDPDGNVIWESKYNGIKKRQEFTGVKQLYSGEIVACGNMKGHDINFNFYGVLYKFNQIDGNLVWNKKYDYFDSDSTQHYFYGMDVCLDGGFVMAGMYRDLRTGANPGNSMWVVKTDCLGNDSIWDNACDFTIGLEEIEKDALFNLYPNPSTGAVTLDYFVPQNSTSNQLTFYDATGKKAQTFNLSGEGQVQLSLDCANFANGVYNGVVISDGKVLFMRKLVLIK